MSDPGWLMEMAIEPHTRADQARLAEAMAELARDDLRFGYETDLESGQNIALANDEDVLNAVIDRLQDKYGIGMNASALRVRYRETIRNGTSIDYMHASGHGPRGVRARVSLSVDPADPARGQAVRVTATPDAATADQIAAAERGLTSAASSGRIAGYPVVGIEVVVLRIVAGKGDGSLLAVETAARSGMREAMLTAAGYLLEPIVRVEVTAPAAMTAGIELILRRRRGEIESRSLEHQEQRIRALVPLALLFRFADELRGVSRGEASFSTAFSHFAPVPTNLPTDDPDNFPPAVGMRA